jgi:hypothetical protein
MISSIPRTSGVRARRTRKELVTRSAYGAAYHDSGVSSPAVGELRGPGIDRHHETRHDRVGTTESA